jgi:hypothetical protein
MLWFALRSQILGQIACGIPEWWGLQRPGTIVSLDGAPVPAQAASTDQDDTNLEELLNGMEALRSK